MPKTYTFELRSEGGSDVKLDCRDFDGVETWHGEVMSVGLQEARDMHASLGQVIAQAEANHGEVMAKRRVEMVGRRAELERQIQAIDAELASA